MATIYDVAKEAGVSRSTVSRVLNDRSEVNATTREKVLHAIKKLNYSPNASARSLALQKNNTIGVVAKGLTDPFYSDIINGIQKTADAAGYGVLFCINNPQLQANVNYHDMLLGKVDGIIFVGEHTTSQNIMERFLGDNYPIVFIENNDFYPGTTAVNIDNFQSAYEATSYLIELGHTKIAHIMGEKTAFEAMDRMKGYIQALKDHNIEVDHELIKEAVYSFYSAAEIAKELITEYPDLTAAFCGNDIMAAGFLQAILDMGLNVPQDFSVVGFDDIQLNPFVNPQLPFITTIQQPRYDMAVYAVKALIHAIEENQIWDNKTFETKFIIKNSTAQRI